MSEQDQEQQPPSLSILAPKPGTDLVLVGATDKVKPIKEDGLVNLDRAFGTLPSERGYDTFDIVYDDFGHQVGALIPKADAVDERTREIMAADYFDTKKAEKELANELNPPAEIPVLMSDKVISMEVVEAPKTNPQPQPEGYRGLESRPRDVREGGETV